MTLLTRLIAPQSGEEKLPVHQFIAALAELQRNAPGVTLGAIATAFNLSQDEQTQLSEFVTYVSSGNVAVTRQVIHDVLLLGEGRQYDLAQVRARLGLTP